MVAKLASRMKPLVSGALKGRHKRQVERLAAEGFPPFLLPAISYFVNGRARPEVEQIADLVEEQRARIAARGDEKIDIFYSPKPGSAGETATADMRPEHGEVMQFTMERVAQTGKKRPWGAAMHLMAREAGARNIIELGTCAGISGSYLGSVPSCEMLYTVEASSALCEIARQTLASCTQNFIVINALFDDALDDLLTKLPPIDFLFIDGHHEKVATIHYWQRMLPNLAEGAIVVFDDISWSADMREGWDFLSKQTQFSHAIDLGLIGIGIHSVQPSEPRYWDLRGITGVKSVGKPWGWKNVSA